MTIRRVPEDFRVQEVLEPTFAAGIGPLAPLLAHAGTDGPLHAVLALVKTSTTTPEAIAGLAKALAVPGGGGGVDYAGLKDKHAVTEQHVSVPVAPAAAPSLDTRLAAAPAPGIEGRGWTAHLLGWSRQPVAAPCITGNRFTLVVRDLAPGASTEMDVRAKMLTAPGSQTDPRGLRLVVVNYFGAQRFGSARHGRGFVAQHLIRGEFEAALRLAIASPARKDSGKVRTFTRLAATKWGRWAELADELPRCPERAAIEHLARRPAPTESDFRDAFAALPYFTQQMCVESFQSHLWNEVARLLARRIASEATCKPRARLVSSDDPFGVMLFPESRALTPAWLACAPALLGPGAVLRPPWGGEAQQVLAEAQLTLGAMVIPGMRRPTFGAVDRPLLAAATDFELGPPEPDVMSSPGRVLRRVRFELPRGAYATVVLRALGQ